ncbi:MAG: phthalate 4,5-dioxygenase, partial [Chloroflexi bacterium]|nr:phthalate 4,5-dioxygenase [Chloroflexota bacterium]
DAPGTAIKGFLCQDSMVNESQGAEVDRTQEHLASSDRSIVAMRSIYLQAIADIESGRDPKHILRDPRRNTVVYIGGSDQLERV